MQQVNLYQAQFKKKRVVLSAQQLLFFTLLTAIIFSVAGLFLANRNSELETHIASLHQSRVVEQELVSGSNYPLLKANLLQLQQQQKQKQTLFDYLTHQSFGNQHGFTGNLTHLSQQHLNGVWLTQFSFINGGQHIALHGSALQSEQIPLYIDGLSESGPFQGKHFSVFSLESPESSSELYTFKLHTDTNNAGQME